MYYGHLKKKTNPSFKAICHLEVIENARRTKKKNILILEDTANIIAPIQAIFNKLPSNDNWNMLYPGGEIIQILDKEEDQISDDPKKKDNKTYWRRAIIDGSYGYIIKENFYDTILKKGYSWIKKNKGKSIDEFYSEIIHPNFDCYIAKYPLIELRDKETVSCLDKLPIDDIKNEDGYVDKIPRFDNIENTILPKVSLITYVTYGTSNWFFMTLMNFLKTDYPHDKLEWLILDETNNVKDLLVEDPRIKYFPCNVKSKQELSKGQKLNALVKNTTGDIILHMFEGNYYPPHHVLSRVRTLLTYPDYHCVGSTLIGCYNIMNNTSFTLKELDVHKNSTVLHEASMAYTKDFWKYIQFEELILNDNHKNIVSLPFLANRLNIVMDIPYDYICTQLTTTVEFSASTSNYNLYESWPSHIQEYILITKDNFKN